MSAYASMLGAGCRVLERGNTFSFNLKVPTLPQYQRVTLQGPHVKMMTLLTICLLPEDDGLFEVMQAHRVLRRSNTFS